MNRRENLKSIGVGVLYAVFPLSLSGFPARKKGSSYLLSQKADVLRFLETTRYPDEGWGRWRYTVLMDRKYALESSAMGIGILDTLGELDAVPQAQKEEAISFFQSTWHPDELYYIDPLVGEQDRISDRHSWEHIWAHMSGAAQGALNQLGATPKSRGDKAPFVDLREVDVRDWIMSLDWSNPWLYGERFTKVVRFYWDSLPDAKKSLTEPTIQRAFATLEGHIMDPKTGLPMKQGCKSKEVGMAGLFKLISGYQAVGKEVPHAERALDSVLALQQPNGQFGSSGNSPMTINWDSMKVLKDLNQQLDHGYRFEDIRDAGNRMAEFLLKVHKKADGGFSYFPGECASAHNSVRVSEKGPVGDMEGTKFSLYCFSYADEWNAR
ncbi:hypothetical protein [Telluribacter sp.]|jgi:hypothetical protein|uniref:hypothetical protein n=1 Tax=Telluribacter sp. TaxID=1978767 RepID=UPI002E106866|nr:hypothetical protein [Telluribacter sp.]